jgi:TPR repeat protein
VRSRGCDRSRFRWSCNGGNRRSSVTCISIAFYSRVVSMKATQANSSDAEALFSCATRYEEERKFKSAFECLSVAANLGHSSSQLNLGNFYAAGIGVRKNLYKAAHLYRSAHRLGNTSAARNLAIDRLSKGNVRSAIYWFKKGIERQDGGSYIGLAKIFAERRGGKDRATALLLRVRGLNRTNASDSDREEAEQLLAKLRKRLPDSLPRSRHTRRRTG